MISSALSLCQVFAAVVCLLRLLAPRQFLISSKRTEISQVAIAPAEKNALFSCYSSEPMNVGGRSRTFEHLAYTPEMDDLVADLNERSGQQSSHREVFLKLTALRKMGKLPRAPR